jgi:hypothetical protein
MTTREQKRARAAYMTSVPIERIDYWLQLQGVEHLTMPFHKLMKLLRHRGSDTAIHHDC